MTGYGRACGQVLNLDVIVELRSVNHRYFDLNIKTPRMYAYLEEPIKAVLKSAISRGKLDVFVTIDHARADNVSVSVARTVLEGYLDAARQISEQYGLKNDLTASVAVRFPDVFVIEKQEEDIEAVKAGVCELAKQAAKEFCAMRSIEGARMASDISQRADSVLGMVAAVERGSAEQVAAYRQKLFARMQEVLQDKNIDEQRILLEAALFADKSAVDEETVRLKSHLAQLGDMLSQDAAVGRKMDFVVQEMNREANTIGSKANDIELTRLVVDIKAEIEKIREQVQNIE